MSVKNKRTRMPGMSNRYIKNVIKQEHQVKDICINLTVGLLRYQKSYRRICYLISSLCIYRV